jgi:hypothetical protein
MTATQPPERARAITQADVEAAKRLVAWIQGRVDALNIPMSVTLNTDSQIPAMFAHHRSEGVREAVEAAKLGLTRIIEGDVPRPIGTRWRRDGEPSKLDTCIHDIRMSNDCGNCISDFAAAILATLSPEEGDPHG